MAKAAALQEPKKGISGKIIAVGIVGTGVAAATAYFFLRKKDDAPAAPVSNSSSKINNPILTNISTQNTGIKPPSVLSAGTFPISEGQSSLLVQELQYALIGKGGEPASLIKNSGGADGIYGEGTKKALIAAGLPTTIDKEAWDKIVSDAQSGYSVWDSITSLFSGPQIEARNVMSTHPLLVRKSGTMKAVVVPANMIIGKEMDRDPERMISTIETIDKNIVTAPSSLLAYVD